MSGRSPGVGRPRAPALPARFRIVDAPVQTFGGEAHRVRDTKGDELAVHEDLQRIGSISGGERDVAAQAEGVVLIHPGVVAGQGAARVPHALELRPREWIERPAFRTVLSRRGRTVERPVAFAPVEAREMTARQRQPDDSVAIDVHAARPVSIHGRLGLVPRHLVDFRQSGGRWVLAGIQPNDRAGKAQHRAPDRTIDRTHADAVEARHDPLVFGRIDWSVWLHVLVALAVAVGVENERRPTL